MGAGNSSGFTVYLNNETEHKLILQTPEDEVDKHRGRITYLAPSVNGHEKEARLIEGKGRISAHVRGIKYKIVDQDPTKAADGCYYMLKLQFCTAFRVDESFAVVELIKREERTGKEHVMWTASENAKAGRTDRKGHRLDRASLTSAKPLESSKFAATIDRFRNADRPLRTKRDIYVKLYNFAE